MTKREENLEDKVRSESELKEKEVKEKKDEETLKEDKGGKEELSKEKSEGDKKVVTLSQEDYDGIKLQMAKVINDYKDLERDLENYRKRSREEVESAKSQGIVKALSCIFPALDTFKKAKKIIKDEKAIEGINLIEKSLMEGLKKLGVKKIECVGRKFDPNFHNAVLSIESKDVKAGFIVEEIEAGYEMEGKVVKFSQVVVAK